MQRIERRILQRIFGHINYGNGWRIRSNCEVYGLYSLNQDLKIKIGGARHEDGRERNSE